MVLAFANLHLSQPGSNLRAWLAIIRRNEFLAGIDCAKWLASRLHDAMEAAEAADGSEARVLLRDVAGGLGRLSEKNNAPSS